MRVVGHRPKPMPKPHHVAELHDPSYFMKMVPQVDVLVAAAPHTKMTERMFNEQVFRAMKPTAYFLAMSRGKLYDDKALDEALKEALDRGAGLDVFPDRNPCRRATDLRLRQRDHVGAHLRLESGPASAADRAIRRQRAPVRCRVTAGERSGQGEGILMQRWHCCSIHVLRGEPALFSRRCGRPRANQRATCRRTGRTPG